MSREAAENEEKKIKNTLTEWTVEKVLDMRKELLDRQKDLEKSNLEMVEKLKLSDEKFENLSNELQEKMDKIVDTLKTEVSSEIMEKVRLSDEKFENLSNDLQLKLDKIVETLKPETSSEVVEKIKLSDEKIEKLSKKFDSIQRKLNQTNNTLRPVVSSEIKKLSKEHQEQFDLILWKLNEIEKTLKPEVSSEIDENYDSATSGKYFVLKHTFNNVSSFENDKNYISEDEEHFGVPWRIRVRRGDRFLALFLENSLLKNTEKKWKIEVEHEMKIVSPSSRERREKRRKKTVDVFKSEGVGISWGYSKILEWDELEKDFVVDDCFCAEIAVKVKKMTGICKENLRSFDKTMEEYSDVILVVNNEKFYVLKLILATDSPYFENLFFGKSNVTEKTEIKLSGIDADDFQKYLEVLYGKQAIDEFTVEGILMVAEMYKTPVVIEKCENFLQKESKKKLKTKLQLSHRYNLPALMKKCIEEVK